jgi:hypothetical protein
MSISSAQSLGLPRALVDKLMLWYLSVSVSVNERSKRDDANTGLLYGQIHILQTDIRYEALDQKSWNCASEAAHWHNDGIR